MAVSWGEGPEGTRHQLRSSSTAKSITSWHTNPALPFTTSPSCLSGNMAGNLPEPNHRLNAYAHEPQPRPHSSTPSPNPPPPNPPHPA